MFSDKNTFIWGVQCSAIRVILAAFVVVIIDRDSLLIELDCVNLCLKIESQPAESLIFLQFGGWKVESYSPARP